MARHGYDDDDFDIVEADGWNQYDSYAMRRAPQQPSIQMTQQMTTKVAPAYDGRTTFFAFEDAIDDWCDIIKILATSYHQGCPKRVLTSKYNRGTMDLQKMMTRFQLTWKQTY